MYRAGLLRRGLATIPEGASTPIRRNPDAYYNLGATHHQLAKLHNRDADYAQAESYYNQCIDKSPNHEECYRGLAVLLVDRGHADQAQQLLTCWSQRSPSLPGPRIELARLNEEQGDRNGGPARVDRSGDDRSAQRPGADGAGPAARAIGRHGPGADELSALAGRTTATSRKWPPAWRRLQGAIGVRPVTAGPNGTRTVNINNTAPGAMPPTLLR